MDPTVEAALIGAAAALIGVGGTVVVAITSVRNARRTNQATIDAARQDAQLTLETVVEAQFADRYSRALEQVGSDNPDLRIGGIYALEAIALGSWRHHPMVMEVLTAFIREHSRTPAGGRPEQRLLPDVQAALTVIGRRNAEHDIRPVDLSCADLTHANLDAAHLRGVNLRDAILSRAALGRADLAGANLARATLAHVNLARANLTGADLTNADLTSAFLRGAFLSDVRLTNAGLHDADLTGADLLGTLWPAAADARKAGICGDITR